MILSTQQKVEYIIKAMSMEAIVSAPANRNDCNITLQNFCREFFGIVWKIEFPLPKNTCCNEAATDFVSLNCDIAFQTTIRNDFKKKCDECIEVYERGKLHYRYKRLVIVFFRTLSESEKEYRNKLKSDYFTFSGKDDVFGLKDLIKIISECDCQIVDKIFSLCQNYFPFDFERYSYESIRLPICNDYIKRSIRIVDSTTGDMQCSLKEFMTQNDRVVLLSDAASGKTQELVNLNNSFIDDGYSAFYFALKNYNGKGIEDLLPKGYALYSNAILILDAYDEINCDYIDAFERELNIFSSKYNLGKIIISSRSNFYDKNSGPLDDFSKILLNDLNILDIENYFKLKLGETADKELEKCKSNEIYELLFNPFYLVNIVDTINKDKSFSSRVELLQCMYDLAFDLYKSKNKRCCKKIDMENRLSKFALNLIKSGFNLVKNSDLSKEEVDIIKSFQWVKIESDEISFIHNNYKEYLAAIELSKLPLEDLKYIICIEIMQIYIRPQFYNTLGFLMELRANDNELKAFIVANGKSFITNFEGIQLSPSDKKNIVISIFDEYNEKKSWFDAALYNDEKIAKLCNNSLALVEFLIGRIDKKYHRTNIINAFNVLKNINQLYGKEKEIREKLLLWLSDEEVLLDTYLVSSIIYFINSLKPSLDIIKELYRRFSTNPKSSVRAAANYLIYKNKLGEYFVKELLEGKNRAKLKAHLAENDNEDIIDASESYYITLAIKDINNQDALYELGSYILGEEKKYNSLNVTDDYFEVIMKLGTLNDKLVKLLFEMLKGTTFQYLRNQIKYIKLLIEKHCLRKQFYDWIIASDLDTYEKIDLIAQIYESELETDIIEELKKEEYSNFRDRFITDLQYHFKDWQTLKARLNANNVICNVIENNYEKKQNEFLQKSYNKLFNINDIFDEVKRVFLLLNKKAITWNDVCSIPYDIDERIPQFAKSCFTSANDEDPITFKEIENFINVNWQIGQIYNMLKRNKLETNEKQRTFIVNWCENILPKLDFSSAIKYKTDGWSTSPLAIWVEFFIRKFDIRVEKSIYSDLVCFGWGQNTSDDFSQLEWLQIKLGSDLMEKELSKHINEGRLQSFILINRIKYCIIKEWDICLPYIIKEMENFTCIEKSMYYDYIVYMSNFGHLNDLLQFYSVFNLEFKLILIDKFIEIKNEEILPFIENDIKNDNEGSIALAEKAMGLNCHIGLKYYIDWTKKNGKFYNNEGFYSPQVTNFDSIDYVDDLIELLNLTYIYKFKYERLCNHVDTALENIALKSLDNLKTVIQRMEIFINQSKHDDIGYQHYYIDKMISSFIMQSNII